jgi:hypothetical protein
MMVDLTVDELDVLHRIGKKTELQPFFFKKVKGLKWFNALEERGYFEPANIPEPVPAKEEGFVNIPYWPAIDYLVKTSEELDATKNKEYASKFIEILKNVTKYAVENDISNYRTWRQFSKIIQNIPPVVIKLDDVEIVDYWLDDKFERGLIAREIGEKWTPQLLELNDKHSLQIALKLLLYLFKVDLNERKLGKIVERNYSLRFDYHYAQKITKKIAKRAGIKIGREVIIFFDTQLKFVLDKLKSDSWSSMWQPAIEDHKQNKYRNNAENIFVDAYRDSLSGYIVTKPKEAYEYLKEMLYGDYQTIHRLAVHAISDNFHLCGDLLNMLIDDKFFGSNYRHEMWHLLNRNYQRFKAAQKQKTKEIISHISRTDDEKNIHEGTTAYNKAIWFSSIKVHGKEEAILYNENVAIAKTEPDHPDFSSYMSTGWVGHESPIPFEDLHTYSIEELVGLLKTYKDPSGFREPGIAGLAKTLKEVIKTEPLIFFNQLNKFAELDLAYSYEVIEAFSDLWAEKAQLPWDDIWPCLLGFCSAVIRQAHFWDPKNAKQRESFVANRYWIVSGIGRLLKAGTKSDEHAFSEEYLNAAEQIITFLLAKEEGEEYKADSDAVSISINSPRGHCLGALINLTLRSCRLSDKKKNKDHSDVWVHFQPIYDAELERSDAKKPEYEFATLVTNYLPNFLYMSKEWVMSNLDRIFDKNNYLKWLCAMQGYAYVGTVHQEIYDFLRIHGDFLKALDDENVKDRVAEKVIQNIAVAYTNDFENFAKENSLINVLISRNKRKELNHLIWFIWTQRKRVDEDLKNKVYELWPKILENVDLSTREGKRTASQLCHWAIFVDQIDDERRELLLAIAPYADEEHNSFQLLESIAEISQTQPFEAYTIWMKILEGASPDYPEHAIRKILLNLVNEGNEGVRKAKKAVSEYLKSGNDRPVTWLREIKNGS